MNERKGAPPYAIDPLERVLNYLKESLRLLHMSIRGVGVLIAMPQVIKAIKKAKTGSDQPTGRDYESAMEEAEFAKNEVEAGFPLFHAHALVGLWGAMQSAIEDCVVGILCNEATLLTESVFARVKVSIAQFEALEHEERIRFVVDEVSHQSGASSHGVDLFEGLLDKVKLSGEVPPQTKKLIWEMHHVRNVIVHRAALADRRLIRSCPWLNFEIGDKVIVKHEQLVNYANALGQYVVVVVCRLGSRYGRDMNEFKPLEEDWSARDDKHS